MILARLCSERLNSLQSRANLIGLSGQGAHHINVGTYYCRSPVWLAFGGLRGKNQSAFAFLSYDFNLVRSHLSPNRATNVTRTRQEVTKEIGSGQKFAFNTKSCHQKKWTYVKFMSQVLPFPSGSNRPSKGPAQVAFDRQELSAIMNVYGQMVSKGDWKDYAMDFLRDKAVFSVYRRASEHALYRIEKVPALRLKQGQYTVIAPGGLVLKRGHDLRVVLKVFDKARFRSL